MVFQCFWPYPVVWAPPPADYSNSFSLVFIGFYSVWWKWLERSAPECSGKGSGEIGGPVLQPQASDVLEMAVLAVSVPTCFTISTKRYKHQWIFIIFIIEIIKIIIMLQRSASECSGKGSGQILGPVLQPQASYFLEMAVLAVSWLFVFDNVHKTL